MSDYQRFVTYINLYEEDSKVKSVGFARIESRGKACDMEIHMRGTGYTGISCPVYLFVRERERMLGISVGKIQLTSGNGDNRFQLDGENIAGSGYGLGEICGFFIFVSDRIMFASQWDEKEIQREQFIPLEEAIAQGEEVAVQKEEAETQEGETTAQKEDAAVQEEERPGEGSSRDVLEEPQWEEIADSVAPEQEPGPTAETSTMEESGVPEKSIRTVEEPGVSEKLNHAVEKSDAFEETIHVAEAVAQPAEQPWAMKWQFMLENYPVMTPFEGEGEILCIRMELKDLRLLPKRHWYLGNNSFLLHGFFNYRYIILGAMQQKDRKRWFLGVPGVFQSQEKVMAAIFGFPEYKSEKAVPQKTGQFGYWYRFLE